MKTLLAEIAASTNGKPSRQQEAEQFDTNQ
jgi:hypothetical protein